jgi:hypothetical protein
MRANDLPFGAGCRVVSTVRSGDVHADLPYMYIAWDGEHNCVYVEFKGFATSAEFRTGTMKVIDAIRERNATSLISDNRRLEVVTNEDQLWLRDTLVPQAAALGMKRAAVVVAHQGLGKYASQEILNRLPSGMFVTRTFDSLDDAKTWIAREDTSEG